MNIITLFHSERLWKRFLLKSGLYVRACVSVWQGGGGLNKNLVEGSERKN